MVEEFERCFLVFGGVLVTVIALVDADLIRVPKPGIELCNLAHALVRAFYGKEV